MDKNRENISKESIVAENLSITISYSALEAKYGMASRGICHWIEETKGRKSSWKDKKTPIEKKGKTLEPDQSKDVRLLTDALLKSSRQSKLFAEILHFLVDYAGVHAKKAWYQAIYNVSKRKASVLLLFAPPQQKDFLLT